MLALGWYVSCQREKIERDDTFTFLDGFKWKDANHARFLGGTQHNSHDVKHYVFFVILKFNLETNYWSLGLILS